MLPSVRPCPPAGLMPSPVIRNSNVSKVCRQITLYVLLLSVSVAPLMYEPVPPLFDYPNHLGRMFMLAKPSAFYEPRWAFLPNLAMDATVAVLGHVMPIEVASRVFLALTIALLAGGALALYYQVHGHLTAWPYVVFLFAYNRIFLWGFVNYVFGVGLALLGLSLWLRFRDDLTVYRIVAFHTMSVAIFLAHLEAFGVFALCLATLELSSRGRSRHLCVVVSSVALPMVIFAATAHHLGRYDIQWGSAFTKVVALAGIFRSYEPLLDWTIAAILGAVVARLALRGRFHVSRALRWPVVSLAAFYVVTPQFIFNSEMTRLSLSLALLVIIASHLEWSPRTNTLAAGVVIILTLLKTATVIHAWDSVEPSRTAYVELLDRVPNGARLFTVVFHDREPWSPLPEALDHLSSLAVRRGVFVPTIFVSPYTPSPWPYARRTDLCIEPVLISCCRRRQTGSASRASMSICSLPMADGWLASKSSRQLARVSYIGYSRRRRGV